MEVGTLKAKTEKKAIFSSPNTSVLPNTNDEPASVWARNSLTLSPNHSKAEYPHVVRRMSKANRNCKAKPQNTGRNFT